MRTSQGLDGGERMGNLFLMLAPTCPAARPADVLEALNHPAELAQKALQAVEVASFEAFTFELEVGALEDLSRADRRTAEPRAVRRMVEVGKLFSAAWARLDMADEAGAGDSTPVREALQEAQAGFRRACRGLAGGKLRLAA